MADKSIRLEFKSVEMRGSDREFRKEINDVIRGATLLAVDKLRAASPRGVDSSLADSWEIIAPRRTTFFYQTEYKIVNRDPLAYFKLFGRGAGKMPPIAALERWVGLFITDYNYGNSKSPWSVRQVAFLVARKIRDKGTQRNQEDSVLGIRRDLSYTQGSIIDEMQKQIELGLNEIQIGFY